MLQKAQASRLDCFHCGLPVVSGEQFCAELGGEQQHFCCPACRAVATTIIDSGLSSYYQYRTEAEQAPDIELVQQTFSAFDDPEFQQRYVQIESDDRGDVSSVQLLIGGIHCAACVWLLEQYILKLPAIEQVSVSLAEQKASIRWRSNQLKLSEVCTAIASLGYQPEPYSQDHLHALQERENHQALRRLGVAGIGMMQVGMFAIALYAGALQSIALEYRDFMRWVSLLVATPVVFYAAQPFFIGAWRGLALKKPGMDVPVAIAIGLAYAASIKATVLGVGEVYFDSVTMFTFLLLGGRYFEMRARHFSGRLSSDLNSLLPATALRMNDDGGTEAVALFKVQVGDKVLIKPGQVVPADGIVVEGHSSVDESQMTGEFELKNKSVNDFLVAGTINSSGVLTMRVEATGADLQLQSINQLLAKGLSNKPKIARMVDNIASYFVLAVLILAAATYSYWQFFSTGEFSQQGFWIMLSVLVVSCPCALSLATPAALTAATNRLRGEGLLVTQPQVWELMPTITDVVCDKTGTLTQGELSICDIKPVAAMSEEHCLSLAVALEHFSEHPIARAFALTDIAAPAPVKNFDIVHGQGLQGCIEGETYRIGTSSFAAGLYGQQKEALPVGFQSGQWLLLSNESAPLCWFRLQDTLREGAQQLVSSLQQRKLRVHMLSGDGSGAAEQLSQQLSIDICIAGASPKQKLDYIHGLQRSGAKVLMLGDGINDVPVLAAADVSVAMANASSLAKTHADSILLSGQLRGVLTLMGLAVKTCSTIRQNLGWALAYNISAIPLAAMGLIPPYLAAIGMSLSSLVVVVNALRLQRSKANPLAEESSLLVKEATC